MRSKKKPCLSWKLYVITDKAGLKKGSVAASVREAILGGADVVQLRDKSASDSELIAQAKELLALTRAAGIPLIVNDRIGVAKKAGADGVHLGQDDAGLKEARAVLGKRALIGRSTHSPEQALRAQAEGFDYIGVGPVFLTPTKPSYEPVGLELVRFAAKNITIPFVAIGGINEKNILQVKSAGARTVAVVRAVMASADPQRSAESLRELMA